MKEKYPIIVALLLFTALTIVILPCGFGQELTVEELWSNPMEVYDLAVSSDGNYIAAVNDTGLYFFSADNPDPLWWFEAQNGFTSVAISGDGNYVVAGNGTEDTGYIGYFADALSLSGRVSDATWWSRNLMGAVEPGTLDMSSDGNYVVVGGTGVNIYYFADCTSRSGPDQTWTWIDPTLGIEIYSVDMSSDGKYVVASGIYDTDEGFVAFYKDADTKSDPVIRDWYVLKKNSAIVDVAVSDDGYAVASASSPLRLTLCYWADASTLTGEPAATWTSTYIYTSVDMSSDGDKVVAVGGDLLGAPYLHFWSGARDLSGKPMETWVALQDVNELHAAISDDGGLIVATTYVDGSHSIVFFTSDGEVIDEFPLMSSSPIISMSEDGSIVAVGGSGYDSIYVFKVTRPRLVGGLVSSPLPTAPIAIIAAIVVATVLVTKVWLHR